MLISIIRTMILYVFIIVAIRLMGKRQISDMQPSELVVTLVISDIASLPMQNVSQPLLSGVVPVLVLVALEIATSVFMLKNRRFRRAVCGTPVVVIENGAILQKQMKRLRMSTEELCAQLRQQGIFSLQDVQYCIVETNGSLSVLEQPQKRVPNAEQQNITIPDNGIEAVVISDGEILESSLKLCDTDREQINNILLKNHMPLDNVFLMTLDNKGKYQIIERDTV
ncbi:MAG: DUF421 domain-containing protein [Ruminococcus sp.]|nr:DUF421 domain-containing protein [Ruminococcus sp.]